MGDPAPNLIARKKLLYDQQVLSASTNIAASAENTIGQETAPELVLTQTEVAEITDIEIFAPVNATTGAFEGPETIRPIISGEDYQGGKFFRLRADLDSVFSVPKDRFTGQLSNYEHGSRIYYNLGLGLPQLIKLGLTNSVKAEDPMSSWIVKNTTIKVGKGGKIDFKYTNGSNVVDANWRVRAWGYKYPTELADAYVQQAYAGRRVVNLVDSVGRRNFQTQVIPNYASAERDWETLLGGNKMQLQGKVSIQLMNIWARNKGATTASQEFPLAYAQGNQKVPNDYNNMSWQPTSEEVYMLTHIGVRPDTAGNLQDIFAYDGNNRVWQERVDDNVNNSRFGRDTAIGANVPFSAHKFRSLPTIEPVFGNNETFEMRIRDNGNPVADGTNIGNGALIVVAGLYLRDPAFVVSKPPVIGN